MTDSQTEQPEKSAPLEYRGKPTGPRMSAAGIVVLSIAGAICAAFVLAMALPALYNPPRVRSNRVMCASNLRQIGLACVLYANGDPQGRFPPSFEVVLSTQDITPEVFCCPSSFDERATGSTTQAQVAQLSAGGHLSYVYVGSSVKNSDAADVVVAYEPLKNHHGAGMNVLFVDGHVEWLTAAQGAAFLAVAQSAGGKLIHLNGTTATLAATQP